MSESKQIYNNINDYKKNLIINNKRINILIFPFDNSVALEIYNSLKYSHHVNLIKLSLNEIPNLTKDNKLDIREVIYYLKQFANKHNLDLILITDEQYQKEICQDYQLNKLILNKDLETAEIIFDSIKLFNKIKDYMWAPQGIEERDFNFTSNSAYRDYFINITNYEDENKNLESTGLKKSSYKEIIHVDCFTDKDKELIWIGYRKKNRNKDTDTIIELENDLEIKNIAYDLNNLFCFRGYWTFTVEKSNYEQLKLRSISIVLKEEIVLYRAQGVNIPLMLIQDYLNRKQITIQSKFVKEIKTIKEKKCMLNYDFDNIYVDLDGTLIIEDKICPIVIAFLYQMIKENKKIILITRHKLDPAITLEKLGICTSLFSEIIHITDGTLKSCFIPEKSIFIDNEFPERRDVFITNNIPVFDIDILELFLKF